MTSYNIENVAAILVPFDLLLAQNGPTGIAPNANDQVAIDKVAFEQFVNGAPFPINPQNNGSITTDPNSPNIGITKTVTKSAVNTNSSKNLAGPLDPIYKTGGLVFPYMPQISEGVSVKYDTTELLHANESIHTFRGTENVRITLSNCMWTCDTFENAIYALAALHFFRTYQYMDFGRPSGSRKGGSGRPPSPMWFSAYGDFMYNRVPVLMEKADWSFQNGEMDYVGIPNPGTTAFQNGSLGPISDSPSVSQEYTWMPIKFEVNIVLVVQHSIKYWTDEFSLDDFRSGAMVTQTNSTAPKHAKNRVTVGL